MRNRESETKRQRARETEIEWVRNRESETKRQKARETEIEGERKRERERERESHVDLFSGRRAHLDFKPSSLAHLHLLC